MVSVPQFFFFFFVAQKRAKGKKWVRRTLTVLFERQLALLVVVLVLATAPVLSSLHVHKRVSPFPIGLRCCDLRTSRCVASQQQESLGAAMSTAGAVAGMVG
jgi:hypothetical protein